MFRIWIALLAFTLLWCIPHSSWAEITRINVSATGEQGITIGFDYPYALISGDGRYVAFASSASNLVPGDTNGTYDVFVKDRQTDRPR